jgi:pSer/pThr/pTyr-binding forkhead associated (FHA) protein
MLKVLLIVVQGKPEGKTIPITGPVFRVGRGLDCHLRPNSEEVSRNHTEITLTETEAIVRDLGSRNGTRVNGRLLTGSHTLKSGELLQVGPLTFAVAIQGAPIEVAMPADRPSGAIAVGATVRPGSIDDVPNAQIDAWLVADNANPTPDRPSGVYDGDTLTLESYREAIKPGSTGSLPTMPVQPEPSSFENYVDDIEQLPEGAGDAEAPNFDDDDDAGEEDSADQLPDEFMDESNPFIAAKKAAAAAAAAGGDAQAAKQKYEDTSQAASDILNKILNRRRAPR